MFDTPQGLKRNEMTRTYTRVKRDGLCWDFLQKRKTKNLVGFKKTFQIGPEMAILQNLET